MTSEILFDRLSDHRTGEPAFARAYEVVPDKERSLLKKQIAQLVAWYGVSRESRRMTRRGLSTGETGLEMERPLDWVLVCADETLLSPSKLLAMVVPPLLSGVRNIGVALLRENADWVPQLLVALELSGIQEVFQNVSAHDFTAVVEAAAGHGKKGMVMGLGNEHTQSLCFHGVKSHSIGYTYYDPSVKAGLWSDRGTGWDLESLLFAHPETQLHCFNEFSENSTPFERVDGEWSDFLKEPFDVRFVPEERAEECMSVSSLVLGPGQEHFWIWSGLGRHTFTSRSLGMTG